MCRPCPCPCLTKSNSPKIDMTLFKSGRAKSTGDLAETIAADFLCQQALSLVMKNYHCRMGEIDLIMLDNAQLVFIEVRYRQAGRFGSAAASVTPQKQQKIILAAHHFLLNHPEYSKSDCRFDVVALDGQLTAQPNSQNGYKIEWLKNAFMA